MVAAATSRQLTGVALLMKGGLSSSGAIALIANFSWEGGSPNLPSAFRTGRLDHGSQGLPQWRLDRLTAYEKFVAGKHPELDQTDFSSTGDLWPYFGRFDYQIEYVIVELQRDYPVLYRKLATGGDVAALTADVCWQYERPNKALAHLADRVAYAKVISAAMVTKTALATDVSTHLSAEAHAQDQQTAAAGGVVAAPVLGMAALAATQAPHLPWWMWVLIVIAAIVFVSGIAALIKSHFASTNITAAAPAVTPAVPRGGTANPIPVATVTPDAHVATTATPAAPVVSRQKKIAQEAKKGEAAALANALKPTTDASASAAHAEVTSQVAG